MAAQFNNMAPLSLLSTLQNRIAVLEVELRYTQAEKAAAHEGTRYLLNLLASASITKGSGEQCYKEELARVKSRLQATKLENIRLKSRLRRVSVGHILASRGIRGTKFQQEDSRFDEEAHQQSFGSSETLLDDPTPAEIIDHYPAATSFSSGGGTPPEPYSPPHHPTSLAESPDQALISLETHETESYAFLAGAQRAPHQSTEIGKSHKPPPPYVHFFSNNKFRTEQKRVFQHRVLQPKEKTLFSYSDDGDVDSDHSNHCGVESNGSAGTAVFKDTSHVLGPRNYRQGDLSVPNRAVAKIPEISSKSHLHPTVVAKHHTPVKPEARDSEHLEVGGSFVSTLAGVRTANEAAPNSSKEASEWADAFNKSGSSDILAEPKASRAYVEALVKEPRYGPTWGTQKIFRSEEERESSIQNNKQAIGPKDRSFPDLFRFGLKYRPLDRESDALRTVMISHLPQNATMKAVLDKVRGGVVIWASLLDSISITGSKSVIVTFLRSVPAAEYVAFAREHPIRVCDHIIQVSLLPTPTWPMSISLKKAIYDHGHTRCLEIVNFPRRISRAELIKDLRISESVRFNMIESLEMSQQGVLNIRFSGVHYAGQAYGKLTAYRRYTGVRVSYAPDPCALPLETLLEDSVDNKGPTVNDSSEKKLPDPYGSPTEGSSIDIRKESVVVPSSDVEDTDSKVPTNVTSQEGHGVIVQAAGINSTTANKQQDFANLEVSPRSLDLDPRVPEFKPASSPTLNAPRQRTCAGADQACSPGSSVHHASPPAHLTAH